MWTIKALLEQRFAYVRVHTHSSLFPLSPKAKQSKEEAHLCGQAVETTVSYPFFPAPGFCPFVSVRLNKKPGRPLTLGSGDHRFEVIYQLITIIL